MASRNKNSSKEIAAPRNKSQYLKLIKKGQSLRVRKRHAEALKHLTKAWEFDATDPEVMILVSDCLFNMGNKNAAIDLMVHALEARPNDANIAGTLGSAAMEMNAFELAQKFYQHYINLKPDDPIGYNNYASAMREDGKLDEAVVFLQDVLPIFPQSEMLWNTLGAIVAFRDGPGNAIIFYEECLKLNPTNTYALNNVAQAYRTVGETQKAEDTIRKAIKIDPDETSPHMFLSSLMFSAKNLEEAWEEYSYRFNNDYIVTTVRKNKIPYWEGQNLEGKKIFVFGEQGIGDEIMFTWLYDDIIEEANEVGLACEQRLVPLFKSSFPSAKVSRYEHRINHNLDLRFLIFPDLDINDYDYQCTAGDLARHKWKNYTDMEQSSEPSMRPDEKQIQRWKKELDKLPHKVSIGVAWRSGIAFANRSRNYTELLNWETLLKQPNINLINVQYGDCVAELKELEEKTGVKIHNFENLDLKDDFEGTTALMKSLDLVVGPASAPTMQSQMAGVETWFLLSGSPWWCFGEEVPKWRQNALILAKNGNDPWGEHMAYCADKLQKWLKEK